MQNIKLIKQIQRFGIVCGILFINFFLTSCSNNNLNFEIDISSSGCFQTCPILDAKVKDDKILFNLIKFNKRDSGNYIYTLNRNEAKQLDSIFSLIELDSIKKEYTSFRTDMQTFKVKLIHNKKHKEVYFYEDEAPKELQFLVDYIVEYSKNGNLKETSLAPLISTRKNFQPLNLPVPPMPN